MKLSIIIPVYNAEKYIDKCLRSILSCKEQELEVIVVNDGSKDNSLRQCQMAAEMDTRIQIISKENEGVSVARNCGIQKAQGDCIMFMDADDYFDEEKWDVVWNFVNNTYDFVAFSYESLYSDGSHKSEPFGTDVVGGDLNDAYNVLLTTPLLHTCWGKLFRKEIIVENRIEFPKGVKIGEDYLFVLEYFRYVHSAYLVNETVLFYRQNENGAMGSFNYAIRLNNLKTVWNYCRRYVDELQLLNLRDDMNYYQFCSFAYFMRTIAKHCSFKKSCELYKKTIMDSEIEELLKSVPSNKLRKNRKMEFWLINSWNFWLSAVYFKMKVRLVK